ncbi:hypothetical protein FQN60_009194, partial [Etheostoma spectabile]
SCRLDSVKEGALNDFPAIPKCKLENANRHETVDMMFQTYSTKIIDVTRIVLKELDQNDLAEKLPCHGEKYHKLSIPEALETAKQRLTTLATRLKRYKGEAEARRINRMFSTESSKVDSQWQGNNIRAD